MKYFERCPPTAVPDYHVSGRNQATFLTENSITNLHKLANEELAYIDNPYAQYLKKKFLTITIENPHRLKMLESAFLNTANKIKLYERNLIWQKSARLVGPAYFVLAILNSFFSDSIDQGGLSTLDTSIQHASSDMINDFLIMLTDAEKGLGLSFEEAGDALALASR